MGSALTLKNQWFPLCACGCGKKVTRLRNRFIHGHQSRGVPSPLRGRPNLACKGRKWDHPHSHKGKKLPLWRRILISEGHKGLKQSEETKQKRREVAIKKMDGVCKLLGKNFPMRGAKEVLFLRKFKSVFQFKIIEQWRVAGYIVDAFVPALNVVIEFDETSSHSFPYQQKLDKIREENIWKMLGCEFLRVKEDDWVKDPVKELTKSKTFLEYINQGSLDEIRQS